MNVLVRIRYSHALRLVPSLELVEGRVRLGERLLNQVLGVRGVAGHPQRGGVQLIEVRQDILLEALSSLRERLRDRTHPLADDCR